MMVAFRFSLAVSADLEVDVIVVCIYTYIGLLGWVTRATRVILGLLGLLGLTSGKTNVQIYIHAHIYTYIYIYILRCFLTKQT